VLIGEALKSKLEAFFSGGGKVLATGRSGLNLSSEAFALDLGVKWVGPNAYQPDYYRPIMPINELGDAAYIQYSRGQRVELDGGTELGRRENPYFNRDVFAFCSHQHTPNSIEYGGPGMVESERGIYIAWSVFEDYATKGSLALKQMVFAALERLLPEKTLQTSLPSQGIATLTYREDRRRYVNHLLYASPVKRGDGVEVIEDILPVYEVSVSVRLPDGIAAKRVYLAPQSDDLPFRQEGRFVRYTVPKLECHQMVVIDI
jgi:hypothetical protein